MSAAAIAAIVNSDPDASPEASAVAERHPGVKSAFAERQAAEEKLRATQQAIARGEKKVTALEEDIATQEAALVELQSGILMGTATEPEGEAALHKLESTRTRLAAVRSGLVGMQKHLEADEMALIGAQLTFTEACSRQAQHPAGELRQAIVSHLDAALRAHRQLLRLGQGLRGLAHASRVSMPVDSEAWHTTCLDDRINELASRHKLRRVRSGADAFTLTDYVVSEAELLSLLGVNVQ